MGYFRYNFFPNKVDRSVVDFKKKNQYLTSKTCFTKYTRGEFESFCGTLSCHNADS